MIAEFHEQRAAIKFCFLLCKTGKETFEILQMAYKKDAMEKTQVFEWFPASKKSKCQLMTKHVLVVLPRPALMKMWKKI